MVIGAWVEIAPGGVIGGDSATSICVMRRAPTLLPVPGVIAREVRSHTGIMDCGACAWQVAPKGMGVSLVPSQQICNRVLPVPSTVWPRSPMKFCLLVIRTHLKGRALLVPVLGMELELGTV